MEADMQSQRAASDMLEDALQQFDNIIGSGNGDISNSNGFIDNGFQGISQLLDDLRITIQAEQNNPGENEKLLSILTKDTLEFYQELFKKNTKINDAKKSQRIQNENDSLTLQVSVLSDQVELQMEKMEELIVQNNDLQNKLLSTEELLQKEIRSNTDHERELLTLREQVKRNMTQHTQRVIEIRDTATVSKKAESHMPNNDFETLSPDEGIEDDTIDGHRLKMPIPTATSTPIAAIPPLEGRQTVTFATDTPKKAPELPVKELKLQRKLQATILKAASLERLQAKQSLKVEKEQEEVQRSTSQSENINLTSESASSPKSFSNKPNPKSCSSPNLAMTEIRNDVEIIQHENAITKNEDQDASPFQNRKKHGFKKFFNSFRLRRSNSSSLNSTEVTSLRSWDGKNEPGTNPQPFTRGGVRATAGPRLGISKQKMSANNTSPFAQWSSEEVSDWLSDLGLEEYIKNCKIWVKSGATLLQATNQDIERELGIHNSLHKKKLMLSLQASGEEEEVGGQIIKGTGMDHASVARWLDDIGLPQYKDAFFKARIDCRMLHHLTIGDLQKLRVVNLLHTLSLRRAIYTLRNIKFDPLQLKRRPVDASIEKEQVHLWTNHRVMEWLRLIDLAEYAPNLRGSGVHGSLMIMEPLFTGEILASLLHIPSSKSLIRRHLVNKFNDLVPPEHLSQKQKETNLNSLNIMAKVKIGRRSFGPLSRLRSFTSGASREFSNGEYVCPFETKNSSASNSFGSHRRNLDTKLQIHESQKYAWDVSDEPDITGDNTSEDSGNIKIVELDESATKKIGAFSAEIATMTNKWSED